MRRIFIALLGLFILQASIAAQDNVIISEFMAANSRTLADENGEYSDWIEIYNGGANAVNLEGWHLTDDQGFLTKWTFPATNLNAGAFLVVFASDKDRRVAGRELHTNFKLSAGGEYLALVRPDGTNIVTEFPPPFRSQAPDVSFGFGVLTTNLTLINSNSPARVRIPDGQDEDVDWRTIAYDDGAWIAGTNGVGYGTTNVTQADYGASVLPTAPVGYWRFSESTGPTAVNLGSGAALNGTYTSATVGTAGPRPIDSLNGFEPNNLAPTFNGTSAYVGVNNSLLNNSAAFSMAGWIKPAVTPGSRIGLFGQNDVVEFGFIGGIGMQCWTPSGGSLDVTYPFPMNTWHHIAVVGNGSNLRIFADGSLIGTGGGGTANYGSSANTFNIGGGGIFDATGNFFNGQIDEVSVYHRALTTNEIKALFQAGLTPAGFSVVPYINTDVGPAMSNVNASAYIRIPFTVSEPTNVALLTLRMRFDDGFVAFLNGEEVARVNAGASTSYDSAATNVHSALAVEEYRFVPRYLQPGVNILAIQGLNLAAADQDFLVAAELIAKIIEARNSNPVYLSQPTPGAPNAAGAPIPGPAIEKVNHTPAVPLDSADITVTATVFQTFNPVASAALRYRVMFGSEIEIQMFDDGLHGDTAANDGIFGAIIPSSAGTNGQMIRWSINATDTLGRSSRWPLFADAAGTPGYLGTVVEPSYVTSKLPIIHLFINPAQQGLVDSQGGGPASVFHDGEFYDNVRMQLRGNSTAGYSKKSHRIEFNNQHRFRHSGPGPRLRNTSFVADYPDPTYMRQGLAFWLCDQIGAPAPFYIPVRLQLNGDFYQLANHNDVHGDELLDRLGYDPNGALYNAAGTVQASGFSTGILEKKTREWEGNTDYVTLANAIVETLPTATRRTNIFEMLDLPEVINYLVAARFVQENDDVWANMSLYHDNDGDGLWRIVPFDMNLSWGALFYDNAANDNGIQATNDNHKSFPLYGSSVALSLTSGNFNRIYDVIFQVPQTREMFLRRMRTMMDTLVLPPGTPLNASPIEQRMLAWRDLILEEAERDRARWGWPGIGGQGNLPPGTNLVFGVSDLLQQFFYPRRQHFYGKHSVINTALPIGITKTQNAGIPVSQPASAAIQIANFEFNPSSGNQAQEYIQLTNANNYAVDISGWRLDGAIQFTFQPGTVMPSNSVMYVSPNVLAFRSRTAGPRGGQGLFVQGNYKGQLSARGETVQLYDNYGRLVHDNGFVGNPTGAQLYLRITELMYHPPGTNSADELEFIELKNTGPVTISLAGVHFTNGIEFNFTGSAVTSLAPGERVLVVENLSAFVARYGAGLPVAGEYSGNLENRGETVRLDDAVGEKILEFSYDNQWYPITDGFGFSLAIVNENAPWYTWAEKASWRPSGQLGGSPALVDPAPPSISPVLINEALTRSDVPPPTDTIELYNPTATNVNIGGWFLTDDFNTPKKFRIENGTTMTPGSHLLFDESRFNPVPGTAPSFALSSDGDEVYLFSADADGNLTGYAHGFNFGAADDGVPFGRYITSIAEEHFVAQSAPSLGAANAAPRVGPIVISEVMYRPPDVAGEDNSLDEFVEFTNLGAQSLPLFESTSPTNTWQIKGGIDYIFPTNIVILGDEIFLLVNFAPSDAAAAARFRNKYGVANEIRLFGPYQGKLKNSDQSIELKKTTTATAGKVPYISVDRVSYRDSAPWPIGADGYGLSLQRKAISEYGNDPINWVAAAPTAGRPNGVTGNPPRIDQQPLSQRAVASSNITLRVVASGQPLYYQWRFNGVNVTHATNATLDLPSFQPNQAGNYVVAVFNSGGSQVSSSATLTTFFPVTVLIPPAGKTVRLATVNTVATTNITFSVAASSSGSLRYQWRFNGNEIFGATNSSYNLTSVSVTNNGTYDAMVSDEVRSVISDPAILAVLVSPTLTQPLPARINLLQWDTLVMPVSVSGFPSPFSFRFSRGSTILANFTTSSPSAVHALANVQTSNSAIYSVVISNIAGAVSTFSTVTVLADNDRDRMADTWEVQYGFNTNDLNDASLDKDNDGLSNAQEYLTGTNPTNALSTFRIEGFTVTNASRFSFFAVSNKTYSVQYHPSLADTNWINLTNITARTTNRTAIIIDAPLSSPRRFYRLVTP